MLFHLYEQTLKTTSRKVRDTITDVKPDWHPTLCLWRDQLSTDHLSCKTKKTTLRSRTSWFYNLLYQTILSWYVINCISWQYISTSFESC